jgi:hypothetical protein
MLIPGGLVVCEIDNPFAPPASATAQLTVVVRTGATAGQVAKVIPLAGVHPSSLTRFRDRVLVTDYTSGGLYAVAF